MQECKKENKELKATNDTGHRFYTQLEKELHDCNQRYKRLEKEKEYYANRLKAADEGFIILRTTNQNNINELKACNEELNRLEEKNRHNINGWRDCDKRLASCNEAYSNLENENKNNFNKMERL